MRKSTLFISAVLTAFMLAVLFGVASAYQRVVSPIPTPLAIATQPALQPVSQSALVLPSPPANITPEQAAALASKVMGRTDLYSVTTTTLNGTNVYLVTFSSGDLVYVSLDGQILSISKLAATVFNQPTGPSGLGSTHSGGSGEGGEGNDD